MRRCDRRRAGTLPRRRRGSGRAPLHRCYGGRLDQGDQAVDRVLAVALLAAMPLGGQDQDPVLGQPSSRQPLQAGADPAADVLAEPQHHQVWIPLRQPRHLRQRPPARLAVLGEELDHHHLAPQPRARHRRARQRPARELRQRPPDRGSRRRRRQLRRSAADPGPRGRAYEQPAERAGAPAGRVSHRHGPMVSTRRTRRADPRVASSTRAP